MECFDPLSIRLGAALLRDRVKVRQERRGIWKPESPVSGRQVRTKGGGSNFGGDFGAQL